MPFDAAPPDTPHARDNPPWFDCGDPSGPDFGRLFARAGALPGSTVLSFDRAGARMAAALAPGQALEPEMILHGRRFDVVRLAPGDEASRG